MRQIYVHYLCVVIDKHYKGLKADVEAKDNKVKYK